MATMVSIVVGYGIAEGAELQAWMYGVLGPLAMVNATLVIVTVLSYGKRFLKRTRGRARIKFQAIDSDVARSHPLEFVTKPWGSFSTLEEGSGYKIKRLVVQPGQRLSLQKHRRRAEWLASPGLGPPITRTIGPLPYAWAGTVATDGSPEGCNLNGAPNPFSEGVFKGKIAFIQRGTCAARDKVRNAQAAGGIPLLNVRWRVTTVPIRSS